jgi:hypothetical protein
MKPLALALAAVLGTGCIIVDDDDTPCSTASLTLEWDFLTFDGVTGTVTGCAGADVDWVDVYVDGQFADSFPCTDGAGTVSAWSGSVVTAEGIDGLGRIAYRDWVTAPSGCGSRFAAVRPAEGAVNLNYSSPACVSSPCFLWFSVYDEEARALAAVVATDSPASVKDDYPYPDDVVIRLAVGSYTLDWMQLVSSSYTHEAISCAPSTFDVGGAALTDRPVGLVASCAD